MQIDVQYHVEAAQAGSFVMGWKEMQTVVVYCVHGLGGGGGAPLGIEELAVPPVPAVAVPPPPIGH